MSRYLPKNTKTGDFNTQRTLYGSFFVIPERLASIRAVVLAFTANKQTNEHSQLYIIIDYIIYIILYVYICQDGGAVGFVDFTKLLFALSSLAQPLKRVRSIPEHFFVILSQRKACA